MSPRITAFVRFVIVAFIVAFLPLAAHAQTCTPPTITQIGGLNPSCTGSPVTLDAGDGWVTYAWSTGATTRTITDTPLVNTTYTVTATDALGCSVTSQPYEVTTYATLAPPVIETQDELCPGSGGYAWVDPPVGTGYTAFEWSIVNGTMPYSTTASSVVFAAGESGDVELSVTVTDLNGCTATSTTNIPLASIPPPSIYVYEESICPGTNGFGYAVVEPPPAGIEYSTYEWSIVNGTISYGANTSGASFHADGSAPVELTVTVHDTRGCESTASAIVPIRVIPPPSIYVYEESICPGPNGFGYAVVQPPPAGIEYSTYEWSIVNGTISYGANTSGASFHADGNAPVELTVRVRDTRGCESTASAIVPIRVIPPPSIYVYEESICPGPNGFGYAVVQPPSAGIEYSTYEWSIVNGTISYGANTSGASFHADGNAPVELTVRVRDTRACESTGSAVVPIRTIPPPSIHVYEETICPGPNGLGYAVVEPPPAGIEYSTFQWSIVNGTITYGSTSSGASFNADGNGPVGLTVSVTDMRGCVSTNSVTVPLGGPPPPITLMNPSVCSTETNRATIASTYTDITWSVANATILSGQGTPEIEFAGDGTAPITVSVAATDAAGCGAATNTVVVPFSAPPIEIFAPETACPGALMKVVAATINGPSRFDWTITNAIVEGPTDQYELFFRADGTGPVTVTLSGADYWGCGTPPNTVTIPLGPMPVPEFQFNVSDICPLGYATAYLYGSDDVYGTYNWTLTNATNVVIDGAFVSFNHEPGTGDVTVTLSVGEGSCTATSVTRTLPVRSAVEPVIELATPTVCQNGTGTIYFDNYDSFSYVSFYATNGDIVSTSAGRVPGGRTITFRSNGYGDVGIQMYSDSNSCNQHRYFTATMIPAPATITASGPTNFCEGGSVTLTASEGVSYLWSNGATTRSIVVTQAAYYTVTVTHANGCVVTSPIGKSVFVQPLPSTTITPSGPSTFCEGGSVTLTAPQSGNFLWSTGATTRSITVSTAGTYSVTITSAFGCVKTSDPVVVTVNANPAAGIQSTQIYDDPGTGTITRTGDDIQACGNPTVRLIAQALDPSFTYSWSTGANSALIDVTSSGTYTLTVTTPSGCSTTSSVNVHYSAIPPQPAIAATGTELCPAGGSVTLTAPAADAWTWSNGATTQSIVVTEPGSYTVRVRVGACDSPLSEPAIITTGVSAITASDSLALCGPGDDVTLTANGGTSWLWSNGATTQSIVVTEPGTFTVTTTNLGCTMPESAPVAVTARSVSIDASGPTAFCEGDSVTLTASSGTSWLWSNGATTQSIIASASGSYGVTATYGDGCAITATPLVVEARQITATVLADRTTVCPYGAIQLSASATGGTNYTYQWFDNTYTAIPGATSSTLTIHPSVSGFVYVKVYDEIGCIGTSGGTIYSVVPTPDAAITTATALCEGQSGSASVADAGSGATYAWTITNGTLNFPSAASVTFTPNGLDPVTLNVTVTNAGCSVSSSQTVTIQPLPLVAITPSGPTTFCAGGSVTLTATAGASYSWSNGATTQSIDVTESGSYTVTVTNANGCSATSAATTVTAKELPAATITASGPTTFCQGGSVTLTGQGGAGVGTWYRNGVAYSTSYTTTVTAPGTTTYVYRVIANGCVGDSEPVTVTVHPNAITGTSGNSTACWNGSAWREINGASAGSTFVWTVTNGTVVSGANDARVYFTPAADATSVGVDVTITTPMGCTTTRHVDVPVDRETPASIEASGPTTFCAGGSVTLTMPAAPSGWTYVWSNYATTQSITVSSSGTFSGRYMKIAGSCFGPPSESVTVNVTPLPTATIAASGPTTFCAGGSVTLTASAGDSYLWSNGATTPSIDVTSSGSHSVTVTSAGCSTTSSATTVTVNDLPASTISASGPTTFCAGGSVTLTASAGSSYLWSNGATTPSIDVTSSGNYSVTVTNANGCSATSSATPVIVHATPAANITASGATTFCEGGSVTLTASAGSAYVWSNGATTPSIDVAASGSYSVTVTNANGCSATSAATSVSVNALPAATITASGPTTFCEGGSVTLTASSGASYLWSNGATTSSIEVTSGGSYSVTVTNANGCRTTSAATTVTVDALPAATITPSGPTTFCEGFSVTLTASAGSSYLWSNGATTSSIDVTSSGSYSVTVTNANGCSATSSATAVTVNALPAATITPSGMTTFCEGGSVTLTAGAGASWLWSNGATTQSIDVTSSGSYSVTITNANGCSATSGSLPVTVNAKPQATITPSGPTTFCLGGSVTLTANPGASYFWSNGATTQSIDVTSSGNHYVTVTYAGGCSSTSAITAVTMHANPTTPAITASGPTTFCEGGSVTLTAPAGFASYLWSNGATGSSTNVTASGNYSVTVTNANGCSATSATVSVTENPSTSITAQPQSNTIPRNTTTQLSVTAGGTGPFTYQWYRGTSPSTAQPISGATSSTYATPRLNKGTHTYWVRVTGTCGVVNSTTATITAP